MASPFLAASSSSSASSPLSYLIPRPPSSSLVPHQAQGGFSCGAALAQQAGAYGGGNGFGGAGVEAAAAVRQGGRHAGHPPLPRPPPRQCPRCRSANTKFCYYNNYSRKQPRYFCRACRRHWTEGGTLRDVPVGGGRKNRRNGGGNKGGAKASSITTDTASSAAATTAGHVQGGIGAGALEAFVPADILRQMLFQPASFTAVGGGSGGYSIDLGAWQQMAVATAAPHGDQDVGTAGGTAPAADANCGAGVQFWSGWQAQDDMSGFDAPF